MEGPGGRCYPAWIERWTRSVYAASGPVAFSVPVVVLTPRLGLPARKLAGKLQRWGYKAVRLRLLPGGLPEAQH